MLLGRAGLSPHPLGVAYSPNCLEIEFYEVRVLGILGSSHSSPVHYPVRVLWPLTLLRQGQHRASSICTKTLQEVLRGARIHCMVHS